MVGRAIRRGAHEYAIQRIELTSLNREPLFQTFGVIRREYSFVQDSAILFASIQFLNPATAEFGGTLLVGKASQEPRFTFRYNID